MEGTKRFRMAPGVFYYVDNQAKTIEKLNELTPSGFQHATFSLPIVSLMKLVDRELEKVYIYYDETIDGLGLKAREPLFAQEGVIEYTGTRMSIQQYEMLEETSGHRQYSIMTEHDHYISAFLTGNPARFISNDCVNANLRASYDATGLRVVIDAAKDISVDTVLTFKYGKYNKGAFLCNCEGGHLCRDFRERLARNQQRDDKKLFSTRKGVSEIVGRKPGGQFTPLPNKPANTKPNGK